MAKAEQPLPDLDRPETRPFWEACQRGELTIQRCGDCGADIWYPQTVCERCNSWNVHWRTLSGRGVVYSWIVVRHGLHPYFADKLPFAVALVELDDAPTVRMTTNILDCPVEDIHIGMPVEVVFQKVNEKLTMPYFRRAE
ncbi:MAG: OB-fold domain-containing protein [Chloroflexi bacterium]|nr:OB-fold domain-containing protein [Chloroflexota bacterium]